MQMARGKIKLCENATLWNFMQNCLLYMEESRLQILHFLLLKWQIFDMYRKSRI